MKNTYMDSLKKFRELDIDTTIIGLIQTEDSTVYFCTPVNAEVIGWTGVDGIHFCLIPDMNTDMVFAVSPIPCGDNYVEPVADTFEEFLSLVIACRNAGALEQISWLSEARFTELLSSDENGFKEEIDCILDVIQNNFNLEAHPNPFHHVKNIQKSFDYSSIPFSDEYRETVQ